MTSSRPNFTFHCLDQALGAPFVRTSWQNALGDAFPAVEPWLMPAEDLATSVPCTRSAPAHCAYRVVTHADGTHTGVCDLGYCPRRTFDPAELIRYTASPARLRTEITRLLGLDPDPSPPAHPCLLPLGTLAAANGAPPLPAVLAGGPATEVTARLLRELFESARGPRLVIFLSAYHTRSSGAAFLRRIDWPAFTLGDACALDRASGALRWRRGGKAAWGNFRASLAPACPELVEGSHVDGAQQRKQAGEAAPKALPKNLRWSEVTLRFLNGHTVSVAARDFRTRCTYAEMGMEDDRGKQPNLQWELLRSFADAHGTFDWSNRTASHEIQKRRERLAHALRDFFRIDADPFLYDKSIGGWQALFTIRPEE